MKKSFKLFAIVCVVFVALAINSLATDFTGYTAISDADDLLALMNSATAVTGKYYLTDNIDLTGKTQSPIGKPDGKSFGTASSPAVFDGNGFTVDGVNISGKSYVGFFGVVDNAEIRNLKISGSIKGSASNVGGLVAYAKTKATIENCINDCSVTVSNTGINIGGILGATESASVTEIKILGCTNRADITGYRVVGGIAGVIQRRAGSVILIEKCINNGDVSSTCTSSDSKIGGILGASNSGTPSSFIINKCLNTGKIEGYFYIGGIVGELGGTDTEATKYEKAVFHVTECMNSGSIVSNRSTSGQVSSTGGILGNFLKLGDVSDCLNTGTVSAKLHNVGGLFGRTDKDSYFFGANNNLNRAQVLLNGVAVTDNDYVNSIGGFLPYKPYGVNYYMGTLQGKEWENPTSLAKTTQYKAELFDSLNASGAWENPEEPVLKEFANVFCTHKDITFVASGNNIVFKCSKCFEEVYTDTTVLTDVFVSHENGILASECKDIGTSSAPFKSVEEAFEYLAVAIELKNTDAEITVVGTAVLENTYETPHTEKTITVTGGTFHFGGENNANRHLNLGGPMVFENITFTSKATQAQINAQNNKIVMGEGIVMGNATSTTKVNSSVPFAVNDVKMFLSGGFYENVPKTMNTDVTVRSGEYYIVSGFNYTNTTTPTEGTAKITVGKTNASDVLKICDLVGFSTVAQTRLTGDSTTTMIIDGDADIARILMSEREKTTNAVSANYITNLVLRGNVSASYRDTYCKPYGVDITGGSHTESSLGYHTFRIFTDERVEGAVLLEHAFFGGDGYEIDETLTTGGYKPAEDGGDVTMTQHSYMEYCVTYLGGHADGDDSDTLCDECGADTNCAHADARPIVDVEATCTDTGHEFTLCKTCGVLVGEREIPVLSDAHNYVWESFDGGYRYVCLYNAAHVYCTYDANVTEFYVSDNGKADGGFSAAYPSNDFDGVMKLAAASDNDVTVYVVGKITLPDNDNTDYEIYVEPVHKNTITVKGYGESNGIVKMGTRNTRLEYLLSGDTVFEYVEFDTGLTKNAFYIVARHNNLVMGEGISSSFGRYNGDSTSNSGKVIIIGGCDNTADSSSCSKTETHLTVKSGTYYMIIGGSSSKKCGLENGTIYIDVLGDITVGGIVTNQKGYVDRQFILGSHSAHAGNIVATIDGNITCINAFCIGSFGVDSKSNCFTAKDVTIVIKSGSVIDYSFSGRSEYTIAYDEEFAKVYDPTKDLLEKATVVIFPLGNTHSHAIRGGVMNSVNNVYINYNANDYPAVHLAERFSFSLGGNADFHMSTLPDVPCTSASGMHSSGSNGETVLSATCYREGSVKYVCDTCSATYFENVTRTAHDYTQPILFTDANCISPATYVSVCKNEACGYKLYTASGDPTGVHVFGDDGICGFCTQSKQDLCEHTWDAGTDVVTGCGIGKTYTCTKQCGKTRTEVTGVDHSFGKYTVTVEPTATEPGVKTRKCKSCGKVETALIYAGGGATNSEAIAVYENGAIADVSIAASKLSKAEKAVIDALIQESAYGCEVKVSYDVDGNLSGIIYSIPLPAEYADMHNVKVIVKDDEGKLHEVEFTVEKGYIIFAF